MEKTTLEELHDAVKEHPYRVNNDLKYLKSYKELLCKLSDEFYKVLEGNKYVIARNMLHDFNRDVGNLGRDWKYSSESNLHVENCISTIHDFIDTGKVLSWYDGVNSELFKDIGRYVKYTWDDKINKYFLDIPKDKIPGLIKGISAHIAEMEKYLESRPDSVIYHKDIVDYWKGQLKHLKLSI